MFVDIVDSAAPQGFKGGGLGDGSRDKQEGNFAIALMGHGQGSGPRKARHGPIGQDGIRNHLLHGGSKCNLVTGPANPNVDTSVMQRIGKHLDI